MADATTAIAVHENTDFDSISQVAMLGLMSTCDISAEDIESNIDMMFSELVTHASSGKVLEAAGLAAFTNVRDVWRLLKEEADEMTRTGFYVQLADRILHDASIYSLEKQARPAYAVREFVFNLNHAFSQDEPTPLNLKYLRGRLIVLLDQFDSCMKGKGTTAGHRCSPAIPDCKSRYANLCAFARDLVRENIPLFAWEDIMKTALNRAVANMHQGVSEQINGGIPDTWRAYLSGARAWVNYNIILKSLRDQDVSREAWLQWQDMFTQANSIDPDRALRKGRESRFASARVIRRALHDAQHEAQHNHETYKPKARPLRIPART